MTEEVFDKTRVTCISPVGEKLVTIVNDKPLTI